MATTILSSSAAAVAVKARLSRDLDELKRAAAGAGTLPCDDQGMLFDLSVSLHQAVQALKTAIANCDRYISATRPAPALDRAAKLQAAAEATALLNECFA